MSAFEYDLDPDDLDEDTLERLAAMTDEDLAELYEAPRPADREPEDPLAGYARPATSLGTPSAPGRGVDDLPAL